MPQIGQTRLLSNPTKIKTGVEAMRTIYTVILCVLLLLVSACAQKVNDPADVQAIKKSMEDFTKATNAGDADGATSSMTDKTLFADDHESVLVGKEAIRLSNRSYFNQFKTDLSVPVDDVRVVGNFAVARGTFLNNVTTKAEGVASNSYRGSWMLALTRQSDGSWKWDWLVANSNQPSPGSTASGEDEKALYQLERDWAEASLKKDMAAIDKILATEFQANYPSVVGNKKQYLAAVKNDTSKTELLVVSDMKAFVLGDRAIVNGLSTYKNSLAGKDTSGQVRWTEVFVKRDGRWQCVTGYATKVQ
jgi:uncharacterized protein (TIGR02246 family)